MADIIAAAEATIAALEATIASAQGQVEIELTVMDRITAEIQRWAIRIQTIFNYLKAVRIFSVLILLLSCFTSGVTFVKELMLHTVDNLTWFVTSFLPWVGKFSTCAVDKLFALPKCFLWYGLDVVSRILYLPFRLIYYGLDVVISGFSSDENGNKLKIFEDFDHNMWCLLDDLDHYIHDKNGMGTGIHIIHFPDSVMQKCYSCEIEMLELPPDGKDLLLAYIAFVQCAAINITAL